MQSNWTTINKNKKADLLNQLFKIEQLLKQDIFIARKRQNQKKKKSFQGYQKSKYNLTESKPDATQKVHDTIFMPVKHCLFLNIIFADSYTHETLIPINHFFLKNMIKKE